MVLRRCSSDASLVQIIRSDLLSMDWVARHSLWHRLLARFSNNQWNQDILRMVKNTMSSADLLEGTFDGRPPLGNQIIALKASRPRRKIQTKITDFWTKKTTKIASFCRMCICSWAYRVPCTSVPYLPHSRNSMALSCAIWGG
jgi:hypothetical protein